MTAITFHSRVKSIKNITRVKRAWKDANDDVQSVTEDLGWFVFLEGSWEGLHVGQERPDLLEGQRVKVKIEAVE